MKKNKKRLIFVLVVLIISFSALLFRLFQLTMVKGDYYRNFSDNKRMKQINLNAPRGNIYDRNGNLLAGNKTTYNLNIYKDRIDRMEQKDKNKVINDLIHILERDGVTYLEDYSIGIYEFIYKDENDYFTNKKTPGDEVVKIIKEEKLLRDIIYSKEAISEQDNYYPINRVKDYLDLRGKDLPITISNKKGKIKIAYTEGNERDDKSPEDFFIETIEGDESLIYNLLEHPLARKATYEILEKKKLEKNIVLSDIVFKSDLEHIENKARLSKIDSRITLDSQAKDDFVLLVENQALERLLTRVEIDDEKNFIIPAEKLINLIQSKGEDTNITYEINEDAKTVNLIYKEKEVTNEKPIDRLIKLAKKNKVVESFILDKDVIQLAEASLFDESIYPRIHKDVWKYSFEKDKADLLKSMNLKEESKIKEVFDKYGENYELQQYSEYEKYSMISIYSRIRNQGFLAYEPITLARNLSMETLSEIEEKIPKEYGLEIAKQPNRYYPHKNTGSHMIGYLGKISEEFEVKEYVENKKYNKDDIVGKTGVEESFEETLKGSNGRRIVYTNVMGQTTDVLEERPSVGGNNLYLSMDLDLQKATEEALERTIKAIASGNNYSSKYGDLPMTRFPNASSGASVIMDVKTGQILALASYPDFDPNLFVNGISNSDWKSLRQGDEADIYAPRPLFNIASQSAIAPGSTFKTVTSLAALKNGLDPNTQVTCNGVMHIGDSKFGCWIYNRNGGNHGPLNLYDALGVSCNFYFYSLGLGENPTSNDQLDTLVTVDDIEEMAGLLKLNQATGIEINIPYESQGYVPNYVSKVNIVKIMLRNYLKENLVKYKIGDEFKTNEQIGQDIEEVVSWVDKGPEMDRQEVLAELKKLGYEGEYPLEGEITSLSDMVKYTYLNQATWTKSDSLNMVIGQGQNAYTPMQIVQLASIIANEGVLNKPSLVKEIRSYDNNKLVFENEGKSEKLDINKDDFKVVKEGMRRSSAFYAIRNTFPIETASKTGTAETGGTNPVTGEDYDNFAWEMLFAPYDNPEIAVVSVVIQGGESANLLGLNTDLVHYYYQYIKKDPNFIDDKKEEDTVDNSTEEEYNQQEEIYE